MSITQARIFCFCAIEMTFMRSSIGRLVRIIRWQSGYHQPGYSQHKSFAKGQIPLKSGDHGKHCEHDFAIDDLVQGQFLSVTQARIFCFGAIEMTFMQSSMGRLVRTIHWQSGYHQANYSQHNSFTQGQMPLESGGHGEHYERDFVIDDLIQGRFSLIT